ncbi:MAG: hypothetical protein BWY31_00202 [Lentisphaerae bacterium ADurb.Bin242]|nr:MAG: hypothetical protein BWY31_00202 [Lentisphaerae bacterium ADurb.Bin242]
MNRILKTILIVFALSSGAAAHAQWADKIILYLPNRVIDVFDVFTLNVCFGPVVRAELTATHSVQVGAGIGYTFNLMKDANRQYGYAAQNGWNVCAGPFLSEDIERRPASPWVKEYWEVFTGIPLPSDPLYVPKTGARDYWEFGGKLGLALAEVDFSLHPVDILDAVLGFFFIDLQGDDLTFENLR